MASPKTSPIPIPIAKKFAGSTIQQALFRQLLLAMSYPGRVQQLEASPAIQPELAKGMNSLYSVIATLVDRHVTLADPDTLVPEALWRWLGLSPEAAVTPEEGQYIVCDPKAEPRFTPSSGTLESPERGATLIMAVDELRPITSKEQLAGHSLEADTDKSVRLYVRGPSRKEPKQRGFICSAVHPNWLALRDQWKFPLGVDLLLVSPSAVAAVPRSCQLSFGYVPANQDVHERAQAPQPERLDP